MKQALILLVIAASCYAQTPAIIAAGTEPIPDTPRLKCSKGTLAPDERLGRSLAKCSDPQVYGEGPGKINPNCAMFCMNKQFGLMNSRNLPTVQIYDNWVNTKFPEEHKEMAKKHFRDCYEKFGSKIDLNDATCKQAGAYNACNWAIQPKLTC